MKKINKRSAINILKNGGTVRVTPSKISPENIWGYYWDINEYNEELDSFLNQYAYYNCNSDTGKQIAFWV